MNKVVGDRLCPIKFTGRRKELDSLHKTFNGIAQDRSNVRGGITVLSGIPGIGKTSLIGEFIDESCNLHPETQTIELSAETISTIESPVDFFYECVSEKTDTTSSFDHPMIVWVDEAQNIWNDSGERRKAVSTLVSHLHKPEHQNKVMAIFSGLGNLRSILAHKDIGASRIQDDRDITLGVLTREETVECFQESITELGLDQPPQRWTSRIADLSQQFPQHISTYLSSIIEVMGGEKEYTNDSLNEIIKEGENRRVKYYERRLSSMDPYSKYIENDRFIEMLKDSDEIQPVDMVNMIQSVSMEYHETVDPRVVIDEAVRKGILSQDRDSTPFKVPIPSFRQYILGIEDETPGDTDWFDRSFSLGH